MRKQFSEEDFVVQGGSYETDFFEKLKESNDYQIWAAE